MAQTEDIITVITQRLGSTGTQDLMFPERKK